MLVDFQSTLDEVRELDLLLHGRYYTHPEFEIILHHNQLVRYKANDKPVIMVLIKSMLTNIFGMKMAS
jgi:50S ribosomal subunit-associated GTPase HflX